MYFTKKASISGTTNEFCFIQHILTSNNVPLAKNTATWISASSLISSVLPQPRPSQSRSNACLTNLLDKYRKVIWYKVINIISFVLSCVENMLSRCEIKQEEQNASSVTSEVKPYYIFFLMPKRKKKLFTSSCLILYQEAAWSILTRPWWNTSLSQDNYSPAYVFFEVVPTIL